MNGTATSGVRSFRWGVMGAALAVTALAPRAAPAQGLRPAPARAGLDAAKLPALRAELERFVAAGKIAGAVTVVARNGHLGSVEAVGLRDREAKAPMRPDTIFRIASMTKVATAVAVMMLVEEGKLAVEDPVEKHLPEFRGQKLALAQGPDTFKLVDPPRPITVQDLLTHTSGMRCQSPPGFADVGGKRNRPLAEAVIAFSQHPLEAEPGKTWRYCGPAFETVGRLVEVAAGKPFAAFLQERLFGPLGMKDTTFRLSAAQRPRLAVTYKKGGEGAESPLVRSERQGPGPEDKVIYTSPGGGLYSTAGDYARLLQMLLARGELRGRRLLQPETVARLTRVHFTSKEKVGFSPGLGMGLGVQVVMTPTEVTESLSPGSFGHGGAYGTQAWADPVTGTAYVLMIQRQEFGNGDQSDVRRTFQKLAAAALLPATAAAPAPR